MNSFTRTFLFVATLIAMTVPASALPDLLQLYRNDPFRRPGVDGCGVCHVNPGGGGEHNEFGRAFSAAGVRITPMLRSGFPDLFEYPTAPIGESGTAHFADPDNRRVVVELEGRRFLVDLEARSVDGAGAPETTRAGDPAAASPAGGAASGQALVAEVPVDEYAREGAFFGSRVVNLPNAKPMEKGGMEFLVGHRFTQPLFTEDSPARLFGFDTGSRTTLGFQMGLTDWLGVSVLRGNLALDRTIELSSAVQLTRQGESGPLSMQVRGGVEGRDNFQNRFAPFVQFVATRTLGDRFSIALAPSYAHNTRDNDSFLSRTMDEGNDTFSLGLGGGLRLTPTVSIVGEWIPRLSGFTGDRFDRPAVSFGVQKATYRHTFEFVVSTTAPMTTSQYIVNGTDRFRAGFNIYRKLR